VCSGVCLVGGGGGHLVCWCFGGGGGGGGGGRGEREREAYGVVNESDMGWAEANWRYSGVVLTDWLKRGGQRGLATRSLSKPWLGLKPIECLQHFHTEGLSSHSGVLHIVILSHRVKVPLFPMSSLIGTEHHAYQHCTLCSAFFSRVRVEVALRELPIPSATQP